MKNYGSLLILHFVLFFLFVCMCMCVSHFFVVAFLTLSFHFFPFFFVSFFHLLIAAGSNECRPLVLRNHRRGTPRGMI